MGETAGFNLTCIDMVQQVETLNKYEKGNFFFSKSVSRAGAELCSHAEQHRVTFDELETPFGPGIQFDMEGLVHTVLKRYGLYDIAKTQGSMELAFTVDGANITNKMMHTTGRFKLLDPRAQDPKTGQPMFVIADCKCSAKAQSHNNCFVLKMIFGCETKSLIQQGFSNMFLFSQQLSRVGLPALDKYGDALLPFKISMLQDLSSFWKTLDMGGACKVKTYFCHCCMCRSNECADYKLGSLRCRRCVETGQEKCFHFEVCDNELLQQYQIKLHRILTGDLSEHFVCLAAIVQQSTIRKDCNDSDKEINSQHICFIPPANRLDQ